MVSKTVSGISVIVVLALVVCTNFMKIVADLQIIVRMAIVKDGFFETNKQKILCLY